MGSQRDYFRSRRLLQILNLWCVCFSVNSSGTHVLSFQLFPNIGYIWYWYQTDWRIPSQWVEDLSQVSFCASLSRAEFVYSSSVTLKTFFAGVKILKINLRFVVLFPNFRHHFIKFVWHYGPNWICVEKSYVISNIIFGALSND